jgi:hypothetical protein
MLPGADVSKLFAAWVHRVTPSVSITNQTDGVLVKCSRCKRESKVLDSKRFLDVLQTEVLVHQTCISPKEKS